MSYKDLEVYKLAHALAKEIHLMSVNELPAFERFEEGSQIRRSSKSAAANIVEGFGRRKYQQDYLRFLICAHASCDETKEHLELLFETKSLENKDKFDYFYSELEKLSKKLYSFIKHLNLQRGACSIT